MRTSIEISDEDLSKLSTIARRKKLSEDEVIREAVSAYVAREKAAQDRIAPGSGTQDENTALSASFGLWGKDGEDGLAYQERLRSEW